MSDAPPGFAPVSAAPPPGFAPVAAKRGEQYGPAGKGGEDPRAISGAVLDTLGLSDRPGAVPLTGNAETKTPAGVLLAPKSAAEVATREAVLAPLAAGSLPVRLGATAALGALEALLSGRGLTGAGYEAALDLIVGGATEAVLGKAGKYAKEYAMPLRAFEAAKELPEKALAAIRSRLPNAKVLIPSIDATTKLTWEEAVERLKGMTGNAYKQGRAELADWMKRFDKQAVPKPNAGAVFKEFTSKRLSEPPSPSTRRAAGVAADTLNAPVTRAAADVAVTTPDEGVPVGVIPGAALAEAATTPIKWLWHKVAP